MLHKLMAAKPHDKRMDVAGFFIKLRKSRDWTLREMADLFGVTHVYLFKLENGEYKKIPLNLVRTIYQSKVLTKEERDEMMDALYQEVANYIEK